MRAQWRENMADFRDGFEKSFDEREEDKLSPATEIVVKAFAGLSRVLLYGFLLAFHGVPFLPWGKPGAMALTVLVGAVAVPKIDREQLTQQLVRAAAVLALMLVILRLGTPPTTSIVLVGAFLCTAASLATSYPWIYGVAAGTALGGAVIQIFHLNVFDARQLVLSGRPFTPDRLGDEALRIAGFMFLAAVMHLGRYETERFKSKAEAAEAAREAAVSDERARIARELHDVVSHHVTAMTLQAEAASMTGDAKALRSVATAGREALTELRRMLGVLRHPTDGAATTEPQPGLSDLDRLVDRTRAGLDVRVDRRGEVRTLPAGVELCVYRVVQEALTNSAKHGDAKRVDVMLSFEPTMVTVEIKDNGRPYATPRVRSGGLGLIGMQERVSLLNGELSSGPRSDALGYEVVARLPVDA